MSKEAKQPGPPSGGPAAAQEPPKRELKDIIADAIEKQKQSPTAKPEPHKKAYRPLPPLDAQVGDVPPFQEYFDSRIKVIKEVQRLLETRLSDNPTVMDGQVRTIEAYYGTMTSILGWADSYLDLAERKNLVPRDPDYTDVDREKHLAAMVSRERRLRDVVKGLVGSIERRISLGQTMMNINNAERRSTH